jgi:hypothetical protein
VAELPDKADGVNPRNAQKIVLLLGRRLHESEFASEN